MTEILDKKPKLASYGQVASEYYDPKAHPTCANFRQASDMLLEELVPDIPAQWSCEVGAGDSLLAELFFRRNQELEGLLITDAHSTMLDYSGRWDAHGITRTVAPASQIPVSDSSLLLVVASLADPYDDDRFWEEVTRVLAPGGRCVLTTPSAVWADQFRMENGSPREAAEFELDDGTIVHLPSHVRTPEAEKQLIEANGLHVAEERMVSLDALAKPVSEKLLMLLPGDPIVNGFVATA